MKQMTSSDRAVPPRPAPPPLREARDSGGEAMAVAVAAVIVVLCVLAFFLANL